ncbi:putative cucumisin [Medicago truncatula]|uniref:Putative cucumisin n=1 Tax=Medicago truncatula TaxID=3880 RepID=A0A396J672_MEDTR|nr:putative cucumisin [Medicago truncatula]
MAKHNVVLSFLVSLYLTSLIRLVCDATKTGDESSKLHIVYMGSLPKEASYSPRSHHLSLLQHVMDGSDIENLLVRSYKRSFNGFAAVWSQFFQAKSFTFKPQGLGLPQSFKRDQTIDSSLVIVVMDTRIWLESESFNYKGLGSIPKKWRGVCVGGGNFSCNKKIFGARFYGVGDVSARDKSGHGIHTTSIAGGVDVITISLDAPNVTDFLSDSIAIGSFHAMEKGILTVQSARNASPISSSVCSASPWLFTVAATTIDRKFIDKIILGNGQTFIGKSINTIPSNGTKFPIDVHNAQACPAGGNASPEKCDCMDKKMVNGKLVLCGSPIGEMLTYTSGAIGVILYASQSDFDASFVTKNPTLRLESKDFVHVQYYKNSINYL